MKKYLLSGLVVILLIGGTYYAGTKYSAQPISKTSISNNQPIPQMDVVPLLNKLHGVMAQPNVNVDDINDFLVAEYGPCWGIPEGQCRE